MEFIRERKGRDWPNEAIILVGYAAGNNLNKREEERRKERRGEERR